MRIREQKQQKHPSGREKGRRGGGTRRLPSPRPERQLRSVHSSALPHAPREMRCEVRPNPSQPGGGTGAKPSNPPASQRPGTAQRERSRGRHALGADGARRGAVLRGNGALCGQWRLPARRRAPKEEGEKGRRDGAPSPARKEVMGQRVSAWSGAAQGIS